MEDPIIKAKKSSKESNKIRNFFTTYIKQRWLVIKKHGDPPPPSLPLLYTGTKCDGVEGRGGEWGI